jgi:hypothetical protein
MVERRPQIVVIVPQGSSVRVELADTDGQFVISYADPDYTPEGGEVLGLRVMSDLPDSTGRDGVIYEELFGSPPEEDEAVPDQEVISDPAPEVISITSPFSPSFGAGLSLEQMLAGAIARDPDTGTIPTEPAPEALVNASAGRVGNAPAASGDNVENASTAPPEPIAAVAPLPPDAKPMDDGAPRDGTPVILYYDDMTGRQQQPARWSPHFGRQFWVDEEDNTLGTDEGYLGWRLMTEAEKEEYDLG